MHTVGQSGTRLAALESDLATDLSYYRARYYDPNPGRFLSEDPSTFLSGGINFYEYVRNSPLGFNDANGLQAKPAQPAQPCCDDKKLKDGLRKLQGVFSSATALKSKVFKKYQPCLQKLVNDVDVRCGDPAPGKPSECGHFWPIIPSRVTITPNGSRGLGGCPGVASTLAHEMVHSCYESGFDYPNLSQWDQEKEAYSLECSLFGTGCDCARDPRICEPYLKKPGATK